MYKFSGLLAGLLACPCPPGAHVEAAEADAEGGDRQNGAIVKPGRRNDNGAAGERAQKRHSEHSHAHETPHEGPQQRDEAEVGREGVDRAEYKE